MSYTNLNWLEHVKIRINNLTDDEFLKDYSSIKQRIIGYINLLKTELEMLNIGIESNNDKYYNDSFQIKNITQTLLLSEQYLKEIKGRYNILTMEI